MAPPDNQATGEAKQLFILVHGTWADDSSWTKDGSEIRTQLNAAFRSNVEFARFRWSGRNSHQARLKAAKKLERFVSRMSEKSKDRIFVIAHSHGGNVVGYALHNTTVEQNLNGVVCFATPFISPNPRDYLFGLKFFVTGALLLFSILTAFSLVALTVWITDTFWPWGATLPIVEIIVTTLFWNRIKDWSTKALYKYIEREAKTYQEKLLSLLSLPRNVHLPLLSLQVKGDEARFGLSAAKTMTEIPFLFFRRSAAVFIPASVFLLLSFYILFMAFIFLEKANIHLKLFTWLFEEMGMFWITGPVAVMLILLALAQFLMPFFSSFTRIGFGESSFLAPLFIRLEVRKLPQEWAFACERSFRLTKKTMKSGFLRHSGIYTDPAALHEMVKWFQQFDLKVHQKSSAETNELSTNPLAAPHEN